MKYIWKAFLVTQVAVGMIIIFVVFRWLTAPPLGVTARPSLWGNGQVLIITNTSDKPLHQISVSATSFKRDLKLDPKIVTITLDPHKSVEAGWLELDWAFAPGDVVSIGASGYLSNATALLPEK